MKDFLINHRFVVRLNILDLDCGLYFVSEKKRNETNTATSSIIPEIKEITIVEKIFKTYPSLALAVSLLYYIR